MAEKIVAVYHSPKEAKEAKEEFLTRFSEGTFSESVETYTHNKKEDTLLNLLDAAGLISSRSEGRRLIEDGAVEVNGETITNDTEMIDLSNEREVRVGKHRFVRITTE